ncbi:MAG TPA: hypothetical protein DIT05_17400 [Morganella sp. (in: Bacteria)]|nr:hypothetical protein [Morganella sp. (in: enterobacteria)]
MLRARIDPDEKITGLQISGTEGGNKCDATGRNNSHTLKTIIFFSCCAEDYILTGKQQWSQRGKNDKKERTPPLFNNLDFAVRCVR